MNIEQFYFHDTVCDTLTRVRLDVVDTKTTDPTVDKKSYVILGTKL